jgi:hypothetical protein
MVMNDTAFIVMETDFQYDDQYYFATGSDTATKVYLNSEDAQAAADKMATDKLYWIDYEELVGYIAGLPDWSEEEAHDFLEDTEKEGRLQALKDIGVVLFYVVEVELHHNEEPSEFKFD